MNDLTLEHNRAILTIDEISGGIIIRIVETSPFDEHDDAQIWLDQRAIGRLYAFLRDIMPETEDLNGYDVDN